MITPELLRNNALIAASMTTNTAARNVFGFIADGLKFSPEADGVYGAEVHFGANETLARMTLSGLGISVDGQDQWIGTGVYEKSSFSGTSYLGGALPAMKTDNPIRAIKAVGVNAYDFTRNKAGAVVAKGREYKTYRSYMGYVLTTTGENVDGTLAAEVNLTMPISRNASKYAEFAAVAFDYLDFKYLRSRQRSSDLVAEAVYTQAAFPHLNLDLTFPRFSLRIGQLDQGHGPLSWPTIRDIYPSVTVLSNGALRRPRPVTEPTY